MTITPYLLYEDVGAALEFLSSAFGFQKSGEAIMGPDGKLHHAAMMLGDGLIMLGCPGALYKNPKRLGGATQSLYISITNVDEHFERAKNAGAKILEYPADTFYGHRRYGAEDPEGHQWYFAQEIKQDTTKQTGVTKHSANKLAAKELDTKKSAAKRSAKKPARKKRAQTKRGFRRAAGR